jgi:hypothetical protein
VLAAQESTLTQRLSFGGKLILYTCFLNAEKLLIMDSDGSFQIINFRTGNSYLCFTAERQPTAMYRIHADRVYVAVVSNIWLFLYEISVQWEVWALTVAGKTWRRSVCSFILYIPLRKRVSACFMI